jgi:hypothetical protein
MNVGSSPAPLPGRGNHMVAHLRWTAHLPDGHFLRLSWRTSYILGKRQAARTMAFLSATLPLKT